jgi:hypothetical protein
MMVLTVMDGDGKGNNSTIVYPLDREIDLGQRLVMRKVFEA